LNKVKSLYSLNDLLNENIGWRKKELSTLLALVASASNHEKNILLRSSICALYAHWEGFIKQAAIGYLSYVENRGLSHKDLTPNMVAMGLRAEFERVENTHQVTRRIDLTSYLLSDLSRKAIIDPETAVNTRDNLNSTVLLEILHSLAIDYRPYITKSPLIDQRLLENRNGIAHGERRQIEEADYVELQGVMIGLMEQFRNDIETAAQEERFRRAAKPI